MISTSYYSSHLHTEDSGTRFVGKSNHIELPVVSIEKIQASIGDKIAKGYYGMIYQVKDSDDQRVYKMIPESSFNNGNEIRISQIAGDIGLAPSFHRAFLLETSTQDFVTIEMDFAGKSLGKWMDELLEEEEEMYEGLPPETKAIDTIYQNREVFYNTLFKKLKALSMYNISYQDTHVGNMMPHYNTGKELQLIDFDKADIESDPVSALRKTMGSYYSAKFFQKFKCLPDLSEESKELIRSIENVVSPPYQKEERMGVSVTWVRKRRDTI